MSATAAQGGPTGLIEDGARSPYWKFDNGVECRRAFTGTLAECEAALMWRHQIPVPPSPIVALIPGSVPATYAQVWECEVKSIGGGKARLEVMFAAGGSVLFGTLPATDVWIQPKQFDISLQFHPRYADVVGQATDLCERRLAAIDTLLRLKVTDTTRNESALKFIFTATEADYNSLVHELYLKLRRGMSHYWEEFPVLYQRVYSWGVPSGLVGRGGIGYPTGVFPGTLPSGLQWKRLADWPSYDGRKGYWTVERKWASALSWDDLYT